MKPILYTYQQSEKMYEILAQIQEILEDKRKSGPKQFNVIDASILEGVNKILDEIHLASGN